MIYLLIHGTFDTSDGQSGDGRWWQADSPFFHSLKSRLSDGDKIEQFRWSGANSELARNDAAKRLQKYLNEKFLRSDKVTIISHSHGGNVAERAIHRGVLPVVDHVSVATPYLRIKSNSLLLPKFLLKFAPPLLIIMTPILMYLERDPSGPAWIVPIVIVPSVAFFFATIAIANILFFRFWRLLTNWNRRTNFRRNVAIIHRLDEVALLFDNTSVMRSVGVQNSNVRSLLYNVVSTVAMILFTALIGWLLWFGFEIAVAGASISSDSDGDLVFLKVHEIKWSDIYVTLAFLIALLGGLTALLWILLYRPISTAVEWISGAVSPLFRKQLDNLITGIVKSAVFGADDKYQIQSYGRLPSGVSSITELPEDVSKAMALETSANLGGRVESIKNNLLEMGALNLDGAMLLLETFDWNELIHTFYFRHSGCCDFILEKATNSHDGQHD